MTTDSVMTSLSSRLQEVSFTFRADAAPALPSVPAAPVAALAASPRERKAWREGHGSKLVFFAENKKHLIKLM